jgi:hypothetical protein
MENQVNHFQVRLDFGPSVGGDVGDAVDETAEVKLLSDPAVKEELAGESGNEERCDATDEKLLGM